MSQPMTRQTCRAIQAEAKEALDAVAAKHGFAMNLSGGSFDASSFNMKVSFVTTSDAGVPADFARNCTLFGLTVADFGRKVITNDVYTIEGVSTRRPKYPISVVRVRDGKRFKWTESYTKRALNASAA